MIVPQCNTLVVDDPIGYITIEAYAREEGLKYSNEALNTYIDNSSADTYSTVVNEGECVRESDSEVGEADVDYTELNVTSQNDCQNNCSELHTCTAILFNFNTFQCKLFIVTVASGGEPNDDILCLLR